MRRLREWGKEWGGRKQMTGCNITRDGEMQGAACTNTEAYSKILDTRQGAGYVLSWMHNGVLIIDVSARYRWRHIVELAPHGRVTAPVLPYTPFARAIQLTISFREDMKEIFDSEEYKQQQGVIGRHEYALARSSRRTIDENAHRLQMHTAVLGNRHV